MKQRLVEATRLALSTVIEDRFFQTERGYQGRFYCALMECLDRDSLLGDGTLLEMEYQKSDRHGTHQRPDIILHQPVEITGDAVSANNYAVWALKRRAATREAMEDFHKLDEMFRVLNYPFGFFINIDSNQHHAEHYDGLYRERLVVCAVRLDDGQPRMTIVEPGNLDPSG